MAKKEIEKSLYKVKWRKHKTYHKKLFYLFIIILIVLFGGAAIYNNIEGWSFVDSLYFSISTLTTVGYGDIVPVTVAGKIFTIFYIFIGVNIVFYGVFAIISHLVED